MVIFFVYILELDAHAECQEAIDQVVRGSFQS